MKIYFGTDHAGFELKNKLVEYVNQLGHEAIDCGAFDYNESDDYPDFIKKAVEALTFEPEKSRAIVLGGSGQGEAIVANRFKHIRAIVYYGGDLDIIQVGRQHNNANVLSLGARLLTEKQAKEAVQIFIEAPFSEEPRHTRRIGKIDQL